jgi:hypothetical protein
MCIGECTIPVKRRYMRTTVAIKKKLVQGYEKDLELIRCTHPGPEWSDGYSNGEPYELYSFAEDRDDWSRPGLFPVGFLKYEMEKSRSYAQIQLDLWEGIYRSQMKDKWALLMIAKGYCRSERAYYGPTRYKRFIQGMARGNMEILRYLVSFL